MVDKFKTHYRRWKIWASHNLNGPIYKGLVLLGLMHSPTFEMMPLIEEFEQANS